MEFVYIQTWNLGEVTSLKIKVVSLLQLILIWILGHRLHLLLKAGTFFHSQSLVLLLNKIWFNLLKRV